MLTTAKLESPTVNGPRLLFPDHHCQIEAACDALRASAVTDDPRDVTTCYRSLERAVLEHLRAEEDSILPAYAEHAPADAESIHAAHDELRRQLFRIGVDVELHCVRAEALDRLVAGLRAHAAHEDREMYPWAEAHLSTPTKRELFERMAHSLRALAGDTQRFARAPRREGE